MGCKVEGMEVEHLEAAFLATHRARACHGAHGEARGQLAGVNSLLPSH